MWLLSILVPGLATPANATDDFTARLQTHYEQLGSAKPPAELVLEEAQLQEKQGRVELRFTLRQLQEQPRELALPLFIRLPGKVLTTTIHSDRESREIKLSLPERPLEIRLDPYQEAPRRLSPAEIPPTWGAFLRAKRPVVIHSRRQLPAHWQPLLDFLQQRQIEITPLAEIHDRELAQAAPLFLIDPEHNPARGFFADPGHAARGITLEARPNPLNPELPAILLTLPPVAADEEQTAGITRLLAELRGDGLFSQLRLNGQQVSRQLASAGAQAAAEARRSPPDGVAAVERRDFSAIMDELADTRVIYVGEVHNRYEDHLLQLRVLRAMHRQNPKLAVGLEMLPRSAQPVLDDYVAGAMSEKEFLRRVEWFANWNFDYRLYREIIDYARRHRLPLVALNLEPGITRQVFRGGGMDALNPEQREQIPATRDLSLPGYYQRLEAALAGHDTRPPRALPRMANALSPVFSRPRASGTSRWPAASADSSRSRPRPPVLLAVVGGTGARPPETPFHPGWSGGWRSNRR
ncbi:MAG: ChaN family lipoprotein [Desulfurivibrio sp.]|nr:ChaN family lipoprotein [Desulfurivibrio sp.]